MYAVSVGRQQVRVKTEALSPPQGWLNFRQPKKPMPAPPKMAKEKLGWTAYHVVDAFILKVYYGGKCNPKPIYLFQMHDIDAFINFETNLDLFECTFDLWTSTTCILTKAAINFVQPHDDL
jgi:hypothetical protein